jgi:hypothetical protein
MSNNSKKSGGSINYNFSKQKFLFFTTIMLFSNSGSTFVAAGNFSKVTFESTEKQTALIELYTSEGCSSCPPAENWVGKLRNDPQLWKKYIPVAFHVDYWNYLGWTDKFSSPENTKRQRSYARQWNNQNIYTPELVFNGMEWQNWNGSKVPEATVNNAGILKAELQTDGEILISYKTGKNKSWQANIALLGLDVHSDIKAGENQGLSINHQFTVLRHQKIFLKNTQGIFQGKINISGLENFTGNNALAVWINQKDDITPVQAAGGMIQINHGG